MFFFLHNFLALIRGHAPSCLQFCSLGTIFGGCTALMASVISNSLVERPRFMWVVHPCTAFNKGYGERNKVGDVVLWSQQKSTTNGCEAVKSKARGGGLAHHLLAQPLALQPCCTSCTRRMYLATHCCTAYEDGFTLSPMCQ